MTTPQAILDLLTKLSIVLRDDRLDKTAIAHRNAGYIERLQDLDYRDLKAACDRSADTLDRFPTIAQLKKLAEESRSIRESLEAADRRRIADHVALSAEMRNEAILLLGSFSGEVRRLLTTGDPKAADAQATIDRAVQNFWAEAANVWARVRPSGGLPEVDKARHRSRYGFALEAWARAYLGAPRLARGFATEGVLQVYRAMTGEEPELADGSPEPGIPGGVARHLRVVGGRP